MHIPCVDVTQMCVIPGVDFYRALVFVCSSAWLWYDLWPFIGCAVVLGYAYIQLPRWLIGTVYLQVRWYWRPE
jgi:hypothetical protein